MDVIAFELISMWKEIATHRPTYTALSRSHDFGIQVGVCHAGLLALEGHKDN